MATVQENQSPNTGIEKKDVITFAGHHDVLLGRGGGTNNHIGNKNFRQLINEHKKRYLACSKVEKPKIARDVVEIWQKLDPPGRFLQKISGDSKSKEPTIYEEVSLKKAREKASQCLRERTSDAAHYLNKYQKDQEKKTEDGAEQVKQKANTDNKVPAKKSPTPDQSTSAGKQSETAQAQQKIVQAAQSHQSDLGLQQLYARQQQNLRDAYIADNRRLQQTAMQQNAMQQAAMQQVAMQQTAMQQSAMHQTAMQQTAMQMARQQAFHEQKVLEHHTKMLLQQQMVMQEQLLKNNIMAQQLMMQRNGYAMAAAQQAAAQQGLPPPGTPEAARRMSLNTGFSQMAIKNGGVPPAHPVPQNNPSMQQHHHVPPSSPAMPHRAPQSNTALQHHVPNSPAMQHHVTPNSPAIHNSPAVRSNAAGHSSPAMHGSPAIHASPTVSAGQMMTSKIASIPVQPNLSQRNMVQPDVTPQPQPSTAFSSSQETADVHPIPFDTNHNEIDNTAILEYTKHLGKDDEPQKPQADAKLQGTPKNTKKKSSNSTKSKIPAVIATNSSDNLDQIKPATVSSSEASHQNDQNGLTDPPEHLHDSGKLSHLSDYDAALQDYHTRLNDAGSHVFDDDSSEEMLKDHSALREHSSIRDDLQSTGSCDHSLLRKKGGRKARRTSKSSVMSMSIGSLSGMDYSAEELRDHKMHSSRSFGSNRSLMSELTDYQDLIS